MSVSVLIPTYNERGTIVELISEVRAVFAGTPTEIIVVDDDSPDGTATAVRVAYRGADDVRVICRTNQSGLASAVLVGIDETTGSKQGENPHRD